MEQSVYEKDMRDSSSGEKDLAAPNPVVDTERSASYVDGSALGVLNLVKLQDKHHPITWPVWKKWVIISVYCLLQVFVTLTSTSYIAVEFLIQEQYGNPSTQVVTLGQSLFIVGNAVGPAFLGPLS